MLEKNEPDNTPIIPDINTQDRDLYTRLNQYLSRADVHLRQGRGWFIFNADRNRASRVVKLFLERLGDFRPYLTYNHIPWRDFALNTYMREQLNVPENQPQNKDDKLNKEFTIARQVTANTSLTMLTSDLLIISELVSQSREEVTRLGQVVVGRHTRQMATVLVTPKMPHELAADFETLRDSPGYWNELYCRMYESSLMAL